MTPEDYACRKCHSLLDVPDGMDPLEPEVRFCHSCAIEEIERLRGERDDARREAAELRNEVATAFSAGRGSRLAEVAKQASKIERLQAEMDGMKSLLDASLREGVAGKAVADRDEAREIAVNLYRFLSHHEAVPEICDDYKWLIDAVTAEGTE